MKKILSVLLSSLMLLSICNITAFAADPTPKSAMVYVTITNSNLEFELIKEPVFVTDLNSDNKLTIDEAFIALHNAKFPGGATEGYKSGGYVKKFWGIEGVAMMYFLNNSNTQINSTMLETEISYNDSINVMMLKDTTTWSDSYSFFDGDLKNIFVNDSVELTLNKQSMYESTPVPAKNATITLNGIKTNYKTDDNGKVTLPVNEVGLYTVSAVSDDYIIAPAYCKLNVSPTSTTVNLTVVDDKKEFKLINEPIEIHDTNNDNLLSVEDVFVCAHDQKYPGGAAEGYNNGGGFIQKFWGVENGGSYGYLINNQMANGIFDMVSENDNINAYIYSDPTAWSDIYSYFDTTHKQVDINDEVKLTLNQISFGPEGFLPVKGAKIFINGVETAYKTDNNGIVTLSFNDDGTYTVTAYSDEFNMVPSACKITVNAKEIVAQNSNTQEKDNNSNTQVKSPNTGNESFITISILALLSSAYMIISNKKSKNYEK